MKDNFLFHFEDLDLDEMTDEEAGILFKAAISYASGGEVPEFSDRFMKSSFKRLAKRHDADSAAYEEKCAQNAANGSKGGRPKKANALTEKQTVSEKTERFLEKAKKADIDNDIDTDSDIDMSVSINTVEDSTAFIPPSLDEIEMYCVQNGLKVDPEKFIATYQAQGWKLGNGMQMTDWKATLRKWHVDQKHRPKSRDKPNPVTDFAKHDYDVAEMERKKKLAMFRGS